MKRYECGSCGQWYDADGAHANGCDPASVLSTLSARVVEAAVERRRAEMSSQEAYGKSKARRRKVHEARRAEDAAVDALIAAREGG